MTAQREVRIGAIYTRTGDRLYPLTALHIVLGRTPSSVRSGWRAGRLPPPVQWLDTTRPLWTHPSTWPPGPFPPPAADAPRPVRPVYTAEGARLFTFAQLAKALGENDRSLRMQQLFTRPTLWLDARRPLWTMPG